MHRVLKSLPTWGSNKEHLDFTFIIQSIQMFLVWFPHREIFFWTLWMIVFDNNKRVFFSKGASRNHVASLGERGGQPKGLERPREGRGDLPKGHKIFENIKFSALKWNSWTFQKYLCNIYFVLITLIITPKIRLWYCKIITLNFFFKGGGGLSQKVTWP